MRRDEHVALTGHTEFTSLDAPVFDESIRQNQYLDFIATCNDCGYPVGLCALAPEEYEYASTDDWIEALRAEHYVDQIELGANGYDARIPLGWKEEYAKPSQNKAS
jgi:hypothetical protein